MATATARKPVQIAEPEEPAVLASLVRRHLSDQNDDRVAAMRSAVAEILGNKKLLNNVLLEVVSEAVDRYVRRDLYNQRTQAVAAALSIAGDAKRRAADSLSALLDFPMISGAKLQSAKRPEVKDTASYYLRSGATHVQRGLWLEEVAKKLPDDEVTVGSAVGGEAITSLFNAAVKRVQKMGLPYGR